MGKGNRTNNEKAGRALTSSAAKINRRNSKGMPTWVGTLIVVAVLVVLIGVVTFSALYAKGTFLHVKTVAQTEHYSVNASMMSYVIYSEYQNFVSTYTSTQQNWLSYIRGTGGDSLNTSKGLRSQYYSRPTESSPNTATTTWFDYFANQAKNSVEQVLTYCEIANYYGVQLDDKDRAEIESAIDTMASYAKLQGYTTNEYLMSMYGKGVTVREVRKMMELTQLATKMAQIKQEEFKASITDSRVDEEYNKDRSKYDLYLSYLTYSFTATFKHSESDSEEDAQAMYDTYLADQAKFSARVDELKAAKSEDEFTNLVTKWAYTDTYDEAYAKAIADGVEEEEALKTANEKAEEASLKEAQKVSVLNYSKGDDSADIDTWLFDAERKVGDTTTVLNEQAARNEDEAYVSEAKSTYTAYYMADTLHPDNGDTVRDVGHILLKSDTFDKMTSTDALTGKMKELADKVMAREGQISAYLMAIEVIELMKSEGKLTAMTKANGTTYYVVDKNAFEEYGLTYTEDSNVFYEGVSKGDMVEEFENWLFDGAREEGQISMEPVKTTYGYHIMMYVGNEQAAWRHEISETLANADFEDWYKGESEKITVNFSDKAMNSITG